MTSRRVTFLAVIIIGAGAAIWGILSQQRNVFTYSNTNTKALIPIEDIVEGGPGKDGIPSIDTPKFVDVAAADQSGIYADDGLGISVVSGTTARFYPFQILVWHEIVNDTVGGRPLAVTYCPLCGTGIVYDRTIDGQAVEFGVSGKLYQSDLLMYDRKTESLWAQIEGRAVVGPLVGRRLTLIEAQNITWKEFKTKYPNGQVLSTDTGYTRNYQSSPYGGYDTNEEIYFPINNRDNRIDLKTRVLGIEINGKFKAYPVEDVQRLKNVTDTFAGRMLRLTADGEEVTILDTSSRQVIVPVHSFWFAWATFHPGTELYQPNR
ncbi:MAG: DUF3179 domain-containing protein [Candidatus Kerfeldbacteria bacterium]|nr:DUF3179 domain-containing protein [Candidatus Kerfeldbacteria bacterium]